MKECKVAGYITRKSMLYKTSVEYGNYSLNHILGCSHGCSYCYAQKLKYRFGQIRSLDEWKKPMLVANALEILKEEIPRLRDRIESVYLSFATDPFMFGYWEIEKMSLEIISLLNAAGIPCVVLSKGILPLQLANLSRANEYGITITALDQNYCNLVEPNAAPVMDRIIALKRLHDLGFRTWVSIEPYPFPRYGPDQLTDILSMVGFVDRIVFGKLNHVKGSSEHKMYYNDKVCQVVSFCRQNGIEHHIKEGTWSPCEMCTICNP